MNVKVCGMKYANQVQALRKLGIDFVGFIFYPKSPRYVGNLDPIGSFAGMKRVGVFVNESLTVVEELAQRWSLDYLQLHGEEDWGYCKMLKEKGFQLIKVFGIEREEDFDKTSAYEEVVDYFLFDTKGEKRGGNGYAFDWGLLEVYEGVLPYFLSGGIALGAELSVLELGRKDARLLGVDLNSRFERGAGDKNLGMLEEFVELLRSRERRDRGSKKLS